MQCTVVLYILYTIYSYQINVAESQLLSVCIRRSQYIYSNYTLNIPSFSIYLFQLYSKHSIIFHSLLYSRISSCILDFAVHILDLAVLLVYMYFAVFQTLLYIFQTQLYYNCTLLYSRLRCILDLAVFQTQMYTRLCCILGFDVFQSQLYSRLSCILD